VVQVKGSALASRVLWVELNHGEAGNARLRAACSPELVMAIDAGIQKARWYPFGQFVELNEAIDESFGVGDLELVRTLGRFGADASLTTIYRLFYKVGSVHWILARAVRLWSAHYDSGYLELVAREPHRAVARVCGFATPHRIHCLSVEGWCERSLELSAGGTARVVETRCRTRGDDCCEYACSWQ
jgi:hypothetical protein